MRIMALRPCRDGGPNRRWPMVFGGNTPPRLAGRGRASFRVGGFTLIELMIALALGLFLIGGVLVLFASVRATYSDVEQLSRMQESLRFVTDAVVRDARNAAFRDQLGLFGVEFSDIAENYAEITGEGGELTIQYAGLGSCTEAFDTIRVVRNTYFVDGGRLRCTGTSFRWSSDGEVLTRTVLGTETTSLATGVQSVSFGFLTAQNPTPTSGDAACGFEDSDSLAVACTGVVMTLNFEGLRAPGGGFDQRSVDLRASFRNVILNQIFD